MCLMVIVDDAHTRTLSPPLTHVACSILVGRNDWYIRLIIVYIIIKNIIKVVSMLVGLMPIEKVYFAYVYLTTCVSIVGALSNSYMVMMVDAVQHTIII